MSSLSEAIFNAFSVVSSCPQYHEKWIAHNTMASLLCKEYDVPYDIVGDTILEHLTNDERYEKAKDVHLKHITATGHSTTRFLYAGTTPPSDSTFHYVERENAPKHCNITPETRFRLLSVLIPEIERKRALKRPPVAAAADSNNHEEAITAEASSSAKRPKTGNTAPLIVAPYYPMHIMPPHGMMSLLPPPPPPPPKKPKAPKKFAFGEKTLRRKATEIEKLLGEDAATRAEIMRILLKRNSMEGLREQLGAEFASPVESAVCNGIHDFLAQHKAAGTRPKHERDAVDAVMTAVCFSDSCDGNLPKIARRLGYNRHKNLYTYRGRAKDMKQANAKFQPTTRKKRSDCWREDAIKCVSDFIHSDAMSRLDTRGKARVYKVKHPLTKNTSSHPARVWNVEGSQRSRYEAFVESDAYAEFQKSGKTISHEVFRLGLCNCIREPRADEGVAVATIGWNDESG